jgi:deoxyribodipyrimidine photo-lyase
MKKSNHLQFPTAYEKVLERVNAIDPIKYAKTRNYINGQITYLSPYVSRGVISTKQVMDKIIEKQYPYPAIEKIIQELAWREYFQRVWQFKGSQIWEDLKQDQQKVVHHTMLEAIQQAQTGIESIDLAIHGLYEIGYMHNHSRMYIASIACNIGKAYWLTPSKWMYYHLLDGDIASNNCSWQWVSGVFSSKQYFCNQENINKYTFSKQQNTFLDKPYEQLINMDIPNALRDTTKLDLKTNLPTSNTPNIDTEIPTLIYNSYNLDPYWRKDENVNRVLLLEPSHFNQYPVSDKVIQFIIDLSKNIEGIQIFVGEIEEIKKLYKTDNLWDDQKIISKEHPAFTYYPGIKDQRDWMFPEVTGYYPSFFSFWKKAERSFRKLLK